MMPLRRLVLVPLGGIVHGQLGEMAEGHTWDRITRVLVLVLVVEEEEAMQHHMRERAKCMVVQPEEEGIEVVEVVPVVVCMGACLSVALDTGTKAIR